jgi:hypothetical protein
MTASFGEKCPVNGNNLGYVGDGIFWKAGIRCGDQNIAGRFCKTEIRSEGNCYDSLDSAAIE